MNSRFVLCFHEINTLSENIIYNDLKLRYDLPNGFTYLQLGIDFINLFYLNICHFKTNHRTTFLSFWIFDFINKIEKFHFIHI